MESRLELVAEVRAVVRTTLAEWELEALSDEAVLVSSELVANAVLHARTAIRLSLSSDGLTSVRVEVYDENVRMPAQAACPDGATSGRGLNLVAAVAGAWGAEQRGDGKVVWAELGAPLPEAEPGCLNLTHSDTVEQEFEQLRVDSDRRFDRN